MFWLAASVLVVLLMLGVGSIVYWVAADADSDVLLMGMLMTSVSVIALRWLGERRRQAPPDTSGGPVAQPVATRPAGRPYPAVARARADVEDGHLWKARDRLRGVLTAAPADQETLILLGEVYFRMGDLPNAGRHWFLTDRTGPEVDRAFAAMRAQYPLPHLASAIPARAPLDRYPPAARERLAELSEQVPTHAFAPENRRPEAPGPVRRAFEAVVEMITVLAFLVLIPGLWLLGIAAAISLLVD